MVKPAQEKNPAMGLIKKSVELEGFEPLKDREAMVAADICSFWSSLVQEDGLGATLQNLSSLEDAEEKTLSLLSRVLFLISMGVKCKKDEISKDLFELRKNVENILEDTTEELCPKCLKLKLKLNQSLNDKAMHKNPLFISIPQKNEAKNEVISEILPEKNVSISSLAIKKLSSADKETIVNNSKIIYAPETQMPIQLTLPPQNVERVFVPETLDPTNALLFRDSTYGDADIFELTSDDLCSPLSEANLQGSPIIGKAGKLTTPISTLKGKSLTPIFSQVSLDKPFKTKPYSNASSPAKYPNSPNIHNQDGFSPNPVTPSPSLLGACRMPVLPPCEEVLSLRKSSVDKRNLKEEEFPKKILGKIRSEYILPEHSKKKFLRTSTFSTVNSNTNYEYGFDRNSKKKLRQTKLTADSFSKKANIAELTGGGTLKNPVVDKDTTKKNKYLLQLGIQMSLKDKNVSPIFKDDQSFENATPRVKRKTDWIRSPRLKIIKSPTSNSRSNPSSSRKTRGTPSTQKLKNESEESTDGSSNKSCNPRQQNTPGKSFSKVNRNLSKSYSPLLKSPKSPKDLKKKTSPVKLSSRSSHLPSKLVSSPSKAYKGLNSSKLNEEEILADLNRDSQEDFELPRLPQFKRRKLVKSPQKFIDSFDIPTKEQEDAEPDYAYKGDVIRKKNKRQQLPGWSCHECKGYYEGCSETQKKRILNACSRHRSKHKVATNTPDGFWNPDWEDTVPQEEYDKEELDI